MKALLVAMTMVLLTGAATIVMPTSAAYAQGIGNTRSPDIVKDYEDRKKQAVEADKEYKAIIKTIPEQRKTETDPWADVRAPQKKPK